MREAIKILYADDDEDDVTLFRFALRRFKIYADLRVVPNGQCAIEYLQGIGRYAIRSFHPLPDVVFVDWHMAMGSGREFLSWCRRSVEFLHLPVVVLSGSVSKREFAEAKTIGANVVLEKTPDIQELAGHLSDICDSVMVH